MNAAVTVHISLEAMRDYLATLLCPALEKLLLLTPLPEVQQHIATIPTSGAWDYDLDLTSGSVQGATVAIGSLTQSGGGAFELRLDLAVDVAYASWEESGKTADFNGNMVEFDETYSDFTLSVGDLELTFDVQLSASGTVAVTNPRQEIKGIDVHLPKGSVIRDALPCVVDIVEDQIRGAIEAIDFGTPMAKILAALSLVPLEPIRLPQGVLFEYSLGEMSFPADGALDVALLCAVRVKQHTSPVTPGSLDVPPGGDDLVYAVSDEALDAWLWGLFQAGALDLTITKDMLPYPSSLTTDDYSDPSDPLHPLYEAYPGCDMQARVALDEASTASTTAAGATAHHVLTLKIDVIQSGKPHLVFTVSVDQTDSLVCGALVQPTDGERPGLSLDVTFMMVHFAAALVKSTIPGVDAGAFYNLWKYTLLPVWADTALSPLGHQGLPLPPVPGVTLRSTGGATAGEGFWRADADIVAALPSPGG